MIRLAFATLFAVPLAAVAAEPPASSPRPALDALVAELRVKPDDQGLRERIIQASLAMDPRPKVPEAARRHFVKAVTIQKEAQGPRDSESAVAEFREALLKAPWWPEAYYNQAVAQESAGRYGDAIASLSLYLKTAPSEDDAREALDRTYALEAKQEKAAKAAAAPPPPGPEPRKERTKESLGGAWYMFVASGAGCSSLFHYFCTADDRSLSCDSIGDAQQPGCNHPSCIYPGKVESWVKFRFRSDASIAGADRSRTPWTGDIDAEGQRIDLKYTMAYPDGSSGEGSRTLVRKERCPAFVAE
jgi:hypothetical protein